MIESIRKEKQSVLLVDSGAVFGRQKETADLHLKAMELMGYDALNLGSPELYFGRKFLAHTRSSVPFPYLASNLLYGGGRLPWAREYIIKEVGGIRVAILGILGPEALKDVPRRDQEKEFEVIPPKAALERLLPEIRKMADLVVLLSQLDEEETRTLLQTANGIDVMVIPQSKQALVTITPPEKMVVVRTGTDGMTLGMVTVRLDNKRFPTVSERRTIPLDGSVPDNKEILRLVETQKREQALQQEREKRELIEGLKLTPQEFMERHRRKEQSKQQKGEAQ
ncbi:MAG: bifunctional UDP-sugar hydrolase/5'-nucleotidase [Syntrophales bacterium]